MPTFEKIVDDVNDAGKGLNPSLDGEKEAKTIIDGKKDELESGLEDDVDKKEEEDGAAASFRDTAEKKVKKVLACAKNELDISIEKMQSHPKVSSGVLVGTLVAIATTVGVIGKKRAGAGSAGGIEQAAIIGMGIALAGAGSYFLLTKQSSGTLKKD